MLGKVREMLRMPRNTEWINQNCIGQKRAEPGILRFDLRSNERRS